MTVVTDDETDNGDIRWSDHIGVPDPLNLQDVCYRAEFDLGDDMQQISSDTWYYEITGLTEGQLVDIEWTFKRVDNAQQYYNDILRIRMGDGRLSQERQHPYFSPGGHTTPSIIQDKRFLFAQHTVNISGPDIKSFLSGKSIFDTNFAETNPLIALITPQTQYDCVGDQPSSKIYQVVPEVSQTPFELNGQLGPHFNNGSCFMCHVNDRRGTPPAPGEVMQSMLVGLSIPGTNAHGGPLEHAIYGGQLQDKDSNGGTGEGQAFVSYQTITGTHTGGGTYILHDPIYTFQHLISDPIDGSNVLFSPRIAPQLIGLGLIDALADSTILSHADPNDDDNDGISGKANYVWAADSNTMKLGKYGWKAGQPTLKLQAAKAAFEDMGMANSFFGNGHEFSNTDLELLETYLRHLAVPANIPFFADTPTQASKLRGKALFTQVNCNACHVPLMSTSSDFEIESLRNQFIQPFSDFLLHDMGPGLADNRPEFEATGSEWRTPPLWAIGHLEEVNGNERYLHDGRATSIEEAIMWHGREATASKDAFSALSPSERADLIAYVEFPFVDTVSDSSATATPTVTPEAPTYTPTASPSATATPTASPSITPTPTATPSITPTPPTSTISDVRISNVRDVSFTVSWLTDIESTGKVRYGSDPNNLYQTAYDERGLATSDDTHYVTITGLNPTTTYYFDVISGSTTDNNSGTPYMVSTGPILSVPASDTIYGQLFKSDGSTPATGTMVYITLQDADGTGNTEQAAPLSALVDSNGYWFTDLGNARSADLSQYFLYSDSGDRLFLEGQGAADGVGCQSVDTGADSPAADIVLNQSSCTTTWSMSLQSGWNHISLPLEPLVPITAEDVCQDINNQGGNVVEIDRWHNGGWQGHICGLLFNDFDIEMGRSYFIKSNTSSTWSIQGALVSDAQPLTLQIGWNSISIPHTDAYTAESLCDDMIAQGVTAVEIDRWHNGGWQGHICGLPFNDFDIERGVGYFVKATSSGTITPSQP